MTFTAMPNKLQRTNGKMNLPNKLTIMRIFLVPLCMFFITYPVFGDVITPIIALAIFCITSLTDMFDGKIARKYNLITDFGKFLDPVADKILIIGSYTAILVAHREQALFTNITFWCLFVIFFRELAVTSLRMIVADKVVIAANWMGKCKTVSQMVCVIVVLVEPLFCKVTGIDTMSIASYVTLIFSAFMSLLSGINYFKAYWPYLNPNK